MTRRAVHHVVAEAAKAAGIEFPVHPQMLRHAIGYYLACWPGYAGDPALPWPSQHSAHGCDIGVGGWPIQRPLEGLVPLRRAIQDRGCPVLPDVFRCRHRHWIGADQGNFHGTTAQ
jgi:hypothetical protein